MGKTPEEPKSKWGVGETTNQKAVLVVGKTPKEPKTKCGVGEATNQKGVLGVGKTPEEPKSKWGGWGNDQPEGGPRGG